MPQVEFIWTHHDNIELWGSFNNWNSGYVLTNYTVTIDLEPGTYEYKYRHNDQWYYDISRPTVNNNGNINNVIEVDKPNVVTILHISDTHSIYYDVLPHADILIHTGDFSIGGHYREYEIFNEWLAKFHFKHKIVTLGNHDLDFYMENDVDAYDEADIKLKNATILDRVDGVTNMLGINFYAVSWNYDHEWDFKVKKGVVIEKNYYKIPDDQPIDILLTHGPARGYLDLINSGSAELQQQIFKTKPKLHLFGHIHCMHGVAEKRHDDGSKTIFVNSSAVCEDSSRIVNPPTIIKFDVSTHKVLTINGIPY